MGLIFESEAFKQKPQAAATHVLLVACSDYPSLGAAGYGNKQPLGSPRQSAEKMANWLLSGPDGMAPAAGLPSTQAFNNPDAPLGSIEFFASPGQAYVTPGGFEREVTRPAIANLRDAYARWLKRLGDNGSSCGIFYFCGHGVGDGADQVLIADDFGEDLDDAWNSTFHLSNTCQASIRKTKARMLFLVDACMEFSADLLAQINPPKGLVGGKKNGTVLCTDWLVLRAATTNRLAYANPQGMTRFTTALLRALGGHCGRQRPGVDLFDVTPSQLRDATSDFLAAAQKPDDAQWQKLGTPLGEGGWNLPVHVLTERPRVVVALDVEPHGLRPVARAFMERNGVARDLKPLKNGPVEFIVPWGEWTYGANAEGDAFAEKTRANQWLAQALLTYSIPVA
jgi:hypothetical protein